MARVGPEFRRYFLVAEGTGGMAARMLDACDVFVTIGSSGAVYPAARFVAAVRARAMIEERAVHTLYVGPEQPDNAHLFDECRLGKAGDVVPSLFDVA